MEELKKETCVFCGKEIEGLGHNPYPVKEEGRCCNVCDESIVTPARLRAIDARNTEETYSKLDGYIRGVISRLPELLYRLPVIIDELESEGEYSDILEHLHDANDTVYIVWQQLSGLCDVLGVKN